MKEILSLAFAVAAGGCPIRQCGKPTGRSGKFLLLAMNRSHSDLAALAAIPHGVHVSGPTRNGVIRVYSSICRLIRCEVTADCDRVPTVLVEPVFT